MVESAQRALTELRAVLAAARQGHGAAVVVSGEAGVGKSWLLRAFADGLPAGVRVLAGACDDLLTARALGALRDAAAGTGGPLEAALAGGAGEGVFDAAIAELSGPGPAILLVDDVHWADDATLDVLGYVARRAERLGAVLVVTMRDGAPELARWLGTLGPVRRIVLQPWSLAEVADRAAGTGWDPAGLHALTGGNPFFVTEVLAAAPGEVPDSVADAVLTRVARLSPSCQAALAQLAVVPGTVCFEQVDVLLEGRLDALAEAEEHGILQMHPDGVVFRHELARQAIELSLPALRRRALHRAMIDVLRAEPEPDPACLVHHAVRAGDADTVLTYAALAGRRAAAAGSHRQALAHFEAAVRHAGRLEPAERAALLDDYATELTNAHRFTEAIEAGERAVALYTELDDPVLLGQAGVRLARHQYLAGDTLRAEVLARAAVGVLEPTGSAAATAYATVHHGAILALAGDPRAGGTLRRARTLAERSGRIDLVELCLNYQSQAESTVDVDGRIALLRRSIALALEHGHHEHVARGYLNLGSLLYRNYRFTELDRCIAEGLAFTRDRGFWTHAYGLELHDCLLRIRRGDWAGAERDLITLVERGDEPGMLRGYAEVTRARLRARRGEPDTGEQLERFWQQALRQRSLPALALAGGALTEWAWLAGEPETAAAVLEDWAPHARRPGAEPVTAELSRYAARAGLPLSTVELPATGDPYEHALALADSGAVEPTLEALRILDELGAAAAATIVRRQLKTLGVRTIPRGPVASTRAHPAGLTARQADVLNLLADGLTNAEIAERLVLSIRTVDHHVSSILTKLGVASRREAGALARSLTATATA